MNNYWDLIKTAKVLQYCLIGSAFLSFMYFFIFFGIPSEETAYWPLALVAFLFGMMPFLLVSVALLGIAKMWKNKKSKIPTVTALLSCAVSSLGILYFTYLTITGVQK